jgi:hypothetical protein
LGQKSESTFKAVERVLLMTRLTRLFVVATVVVDTVDIGPMTCIRFINTGVNCDSLDR